MFDFPPLYLQITGYIVPNSGEPIYYTEGWGLREQNGYRYRICGIDFRMLTTQYRQSRTFGIGYNDTDIFSKTKKSIDGKTIYWYSYTSSLTARIYPDN